MNRHSTGSAVPRSSAHPRHSSHTPQPHPPPPSPLTDERHTLVLMQTPSRDGPSRTWAESSTIAGAMEGIVLLFEAQLGPPSTSAMGDATAAYRYDIQDLYHFIDHLPDVACLVFAEHIAGYEPHDKTWIKAMLYDFLKMQAAG